MSKTVSTPNERPKKAGIIGWTDAIGYAQEQIAQAKRRITVLEGTINVFRDRLQAGEPFPGADNESATRL